ncbi:hypothetical protein HDU93_000743 [Gonapodya sp. JEL0774]|nr:hypothetical protein HDU93_000743 [Gonapodya sp. JEL0774]
MSSFFVPHPHPISPTDSAYLFHLPGSQPLRYLAFQIAGCERRQNGPRKGWIEDLRTRVESLEARLLETVILEVPSHSAAILSRLTEEDIRVGTRMGNGPRNYIDDSLSRLHATLESFAAVLEHRRQYSASKAASECPPNVPLEYSTRDDEEPEHVTPVVHSHATAEEDINTIDEFHIQRDIPGRRLSMLNRNPRSLDTHASPKLAIPRSVDIFQDLEPLPPVQVLNDLIGRYFKVTWEFPDVQPGYRMIDPQSFSSNFSTQHPLLIYSMMSTSAADRGFPHPDRLKISASLLARCKRILFESLDSPYQGVSVVQALLAFCRGLHAQHVDRELWSGVFAVCISKAKELGLTREFGSPEEALLWPPDDNAISGIEERERTARGLYAFDLISSLLSPNSHPSALWDETPFAGSRASLTELLASLYTSFNPQSSFPVAVPMVVMVRSMLPYRRKDRIHDVGEVASLEKQLTLWYNAFVAVYPEAGLNPPPPSIDPGVAQRLVLYHTAAIHLSAPGWSWDDVVQAPEDFSKVLAHAKYIHNIFRNQMSGREFLSPVLPYCLFVAAQVSIVAIKRLTPESIADVQFVMQELSRVKDRFIALEELLEMLQERLDTAVEDMKRALELMWINPVMETAAIDLQF